jgi:KamA family protein
MSSNNVDIRDQKYQSITLANFEKLPQVQKLPEKTRKEIRVVANVLPFKSNIYCVNRLINWDNVPDTDPIYTLTFPHREMLTPEHYEQMEKLIDSGASPKEIKEKANEIRLTLNPHPAGQLQHNLPVHHESKLGGMQHKYRETILFFPTQGQTCHAYCTFCFRWAQFVGMEGLKFATQEAEQLAAYLQEHPYTTDVLFTGGDPMIMKTRFFKAYVEVLLKVPSLQTIRIGTKALQYWPQRFVSDDDAEELLTLFKRIADAGKHLAIMSHFNHHVELSTPEVEIAIEKIRATGAQIRCQSPIMKGINDSAKIWSKMWRMQVNKGLIPYYMFVARDTGARRFFEVPLVRTAEIFRDAYKQVSGLARTVRGPSMSASPGKVQVMGVSEVQGEKVIALNFYQGRNPDWVNRPFFAKYDEKAAWLDDLVPAFGEKKFFFEDELAGMYELDEGWAAQAPGEEDPTLPAEILDV